MSTISKALKVIPQIVEKAYCTSLANSICIEVCEDSILDTDLDTRGCYDVYVELFSTKILVAKLQCIILHDITRYMQYPGECRLRSGDRRIVIVDNDILSLIEFVPDVNIESCVRNYSQVTIEI